jgi:carboxypeptidase C (cathepsin A)
MAIGSFVPLALVAALQVPGERPAPSPATPRPVAPEPAAEAARPAVEPEPVVTRHELRLTGKLLRYTVTTGRLSLKNEKGETEAHVFFMAYVADPAGEPGQRPLTFSFNGGPGSSSVWLHLGALGPRRVRMLDDGGMPQPPYELVDNENTWLDLTDMVFIDPVGTGYSRAATPELGRKFFGLEGDLASIAEFVRLYLSRYERWGSPLFLVGESYGTTRAAGLSGLLVERYGVAFNGIMLVSSILNFQTTRFTKGNDLPYVLFLPSYTATAWHHKKLAADLQADLRKALAEAEAFAANEYMLALGRGDALQYVERALVLERLSRYTGLSKEFLDAANLRVTQPEFCKELRRSERLTVGRLDSRFTGIDEKASGERPGFDPSMAAIRPPYTSMFNDYVRRSLGYKSDLHYYILGGGIGPWEYPEGRFPDTSESLRSAFSQNPSMRVFVASGYYDLATPYFATRYTLDHMGLEPSQRERISTSDYEAGHMMYIRKPDLARLRADVGAFMAKALAR